MQQEYKKENVWTHTKSNRNYRIISDNARLKNPDTGEWVDCIVYSPLYENDYEMFSREKENFYKEFKGIEINKELLIKDLSARLPYGVICHYNCVIRCDTMEIKKANCVGKLEGIIPVNDHIGFMVGGDRVNALFDDIKPYLRPMSSMTDEEETAYYKTWYDPLFDLATRQHTKEEELMMFAKAHHDSIVFLLENHFDFLGLIQLGLAIEVTEENNPYIE